MNDFVILTNLRLAPILFREPLKTSTSHEEKGNGKSKNERYLNDQIRLGENLEVKRCLMKCITMPTLHAEKLIFERSARKRSLERYMQLSTE